MKFTMVDGCPVFVQLTFIFQEIYIRMVQLGIRTLSSEYFRFVRVIVFRLVQKDKEPTQVLLMKMGCFLVSSTYQSFGNTF